MKINTIFSDSSDIKQTDQYIRNRRNPNDVDFEKEELRILTLSMDEPRDQSFIAHRAKDFSSLGIQGNSTQVPRTGSRTTSEDVSLQKSLKLR